MTLLDKLNRKLDRLRAATEQLANVPAGLEERPPDARLAPLHAAYEEAMQRRRRRERIENARDEIVTAQQFLVEGLLLPVRYAHDHPTGMSRAVLMDAGVKFGPKNADGLYQAAKLPAGWSLVAAEHPNWANLLDDQQRLRAITFSDGRQASIMVKPRYSYAIERQGTQHVVRIYDGQRYVLWESDPRPNTEIGRTTEEAEQWLLARYPNWRDVQAYWT